MTRTNEFGQPVGEPVVDWQPRPWPQRVELAGRHTRLAPVDAEHVPALFEALGGPEDERLWTYRPTAQPADASAMAALVEAATASTTAVTFAVLPADDERAEGMVSLMRIDPDQGCIEVGGIIWSRRLQRTPAATEAIALLAGHVFDDLGYRRLEWKCDSLNEPSRAAAARLGFSYEGRFRQAMVTQGRNRDTDWFSVVDAEWPALRAAYDRWLDPANFDADGDQRTRLSMLTHGLRAAR